LDRLACVEVPQLGLQLLLRRERDWRRAPAAVVADDRPLAPVLAANGRARRAGVAAGMRYATALALAPELRAAPVSAAELAEGSALVTRLLQGLSPQVEPRPEEPGTYWVGASGLERLHGSLGRWAESVVTSLHDAEFAARIAVGFTRFGSYAAARARRGRGVAVLGSPEEEQRIAFAAPLAVLGLAPQLEERFARLGVRSVEEFLRLPEGGLLRRFGPEAAAAHAFARGGSLPVQADPAPEPLDLSCRLPAPEDDRGRLLLHAAALLDRLLADLHRRGDLAVDLAFELRVEGGVTLIETLVPAEPTRSRGLLLELLGLRLASLTLGAGVERVALEARRVRAEDAQLELFRKQPRRDVAAGARAFARLRAELGNDAVVRARLADGHLPERQYAWEPAQAPAGDAAQPAGAPAAAAPCRVRRILEGPQQAAAARPEATALSGGPYALSASWWSVDEADREYYFARGAGGRVEWLYHDLRTRGWVLQGYVD
jgi:protein ImuB